MKTRICIAALSLFLLASGAAQASPNREFVKGFHLGLLQTYFSVFRPGDPSIHKLDFYINDAKGARVVTFTYTEIMKTLADLAKSESRENRERMEALVELARKYEKGEIKKEEMPAVAVESSTLFYHLIYKNREADRKFGFLVSQVYASLVFLSMPKAKATKELLRGAEINLTSSVYQLLLFSNLFMKGDKSDQLFIAYMRRDAAVIKDLCLEFIADMMDLEAVKKK